MSPKVQLYINLASKDFFAISVTHDMSQLDPYKPNDLQLNLH